MVSSLIQTTTDFENNIRFILFHQVEREIKSGVEVKLRKFSIGFPYRIPGVLIILLGARHLLPKDSQVLLQDRHHWHISLPQRTGINEAKNLVEHD